MELAGRGVRGGGGTNARLSAAAPARSLCAMRYTAAGHEWGIQNMRIQTQLGVLGLIGLACATAHSSSQPSSANRGYVAPSDQTIVGEIDPAFDEQDIYITNNSSVAIVITSVRLFDCQNVGSPCTLIPLKIPVGPGQRKRIATVRPRDRERAFSFHYNWTWSAAGAH